MKQELKQSGACARSVRRLVMAMALCGTLAGCNEQERARSYGGSSSVKIDAGNKVVSAAWKQDDLWILTRPMRPGEVAETWTLKESSGFGLIEGSVTLVESQK